MGPKKGLGAIRMGMPIRMAMAIAIATRKKATRRKGHFCKELSLTWTAAGRASSMSSF